MVQINDRILVYLALSIGIIALMSSIYNYVLIQKLEQNSSILYSLKTIDLPNITDYDPVYGNSTDIIIYEYMEYLCPVCASFYVNVFPEIKEKYVDSGKISYVYKNFIVHGDLARTIAGYVACIYKEKGFEEYKNFKSNFLKEFYDVVAFSKNYTKLDVLINETLDKYSDLKSCANNNRTLNVIDFETTEAIYKYKFSGTPSFLIAIKLDKVTEEKVRKIKELLDDLKPYGFSYNMWLSSDRTYLLIGFSGALPIEFFDEILSQS